MKTFLFFLLLLLATFAVSQTVTGDQVPDDAAIWAVMNVHKHMERQSIEKKHERLGFNASDHVNYHAAMAALNALKTQKKADHLAAYNALLSSLSVDGQNKLKEFIQSEKRHMTYVLAGRTEE